MKVLISYETALARHPERVTEIMAKHAKTRGKDKDQDPRHFTWSYNWGVFCEPVRLYTKPDGTFGFQEPTPVEKRISGIELLATKGRRWARSSELIKDSLPPEVLAWHEKNGRNQQ